MKIHIKSIVIFVLTLCVSCTDVIDVDVPVAASRLVVEASINWEKGTSGNNQVIKLSTSTPFFSNDTNNAVTGATVVITNDTDGTAFVFEDMNNGMYSSTSFIPVVNQSYTLDIMYNGEQYQAKETLTTVPDLVDINQSRDGGFDEDALEVNLDFLDPVDEENFYFFNFKEQGDLLPELLSITDEFTNGNVMTVFYEKLENDGVNQDSFQAGNVANIEFYGVSRQFSNYISILIEQVQASGNPFSTTPVALKGNCINLSNPDNDALGYFRLSQFIKVDYTFN